MGSVPDGWWRDRAGAAARLHSTLTKAELPYDDVVLVLEGKAKAGVPVGSEGGVTTVHAPGEGDDEIVAQCRARAESGDEVSAATADRGLIARLEPYGVTITSPRAVRSGSS